ncbi:tripartite-type tricarboxylate transporter receptor subunit TctC [Tamaricihabitans halophyticus]|uniref:Tripartite-type tricarboxylate transporter receptor subunit TctC n=1 Tax=Tamaricihabitans halophyticus TaxID=1262583 RepID=A0A4R2QMF8_9PSEU|nr:tripartite tricarboxylate transporter substrate binding protein [Tamaricihabitans halophyticus]TCP50034.1 tripartite-type tricarboxylate transporter receptor subunit TctC [Tamaricihabitans halophyticus]
MRKNKGVLAATLALSMVLTACGSGEYVGDAADYPEQDLEWTIAFGPGGGNDIMARVLVDILQQENLYPHNIAVENRQGGSGAIGWGYLLSNSGDPYHASTTSGSFLTTPLQADTGWTYADFTLVGQLATDDSVFAVQSGNGIDSWREWTEFAKKQGTVTVGGIGTVNVDFIVHALLADQVGYEVDYVPFDEEGQLQTALTSGALQAITSNPAEIAGQIDAGRMTGLLFTGSEPLNRFPEIPTAESQGFTNMVSMPRGLILPPNVPPEIRDWWVRTMRKAVRDPRWQDYLDKNDLTRNEVWGEQFRKELGQTAERFQAILRKHGAI